MNEGFLDHFQLREINLENTAIKNSVTDIIILLINENSYFNVIHYIMYLLILVLLLHIKEIYCFVLIVLSKIITLLLWPLSCFFPHQLSFFFFLFSYTFYALLPPATDPSPIFHIVSSRRYTHFPFYSSLFSLPELLWGELKAKYWEWQSRAPS